MIKKIIKLFKKEKISIGLHDNKALYIKGNFFNYGLLTRREMNEYRKADKVRILNVSKSSSGRNVMQVIKNRYGDIG